MSKVSPMLVDRLKAQMGIPKMSNSRGRDNFEPSPPCEMSISRGTIWSSTRKELVSENRWKREYTTQSRTPAPKITRKPPNRFVGDEKEV